ncbi:MAG: precorrin-6A synthase (deacetylating) [Pseudomonadota bacterium]
MREVWLIGIGTGSPGHMTRDGLTALREATVILLPRKGAGKEDLADIRLRLVADSGSAAQCVPFDYPERDLALPYGERVERWHDEIARRWETALATAPPGPAALLVWGDPCLYDSTLRIASRLRLAASPRVIPGISALQALTAAHAIPLSSVNGSVTITTGRRLRDEGWPAGAETLAVMLDGECSFAGLVPEGLEIWWGAYLGMAEQILDCGPLADAAPRIVARRAAARSAHGWIMDTYLLSACGPDAYLG